MGKMVLVQDLAAGDVLTDEVLSPTGRVLLGKNIELTNRHISLLNNWQVNSVFIEAPDSEPLTLPNDNIALAAPAYLKFRQEYEESLKNVSESFDVIKKHRFIPVTKFKENANEIYTSMSSNFEILNHLLITNVKMSDIISRHSMTVAYFASIIAKQLNWNQQDIQGVALSGLLHDIGDLIAAESNVKNPNGSAHFAETATLLKGTSRLPAEVILGIIQHREYMNGSGLPRGTIGQQIHPYARIIAVADRFHSLAYTKAGINPFPILNLLTNEMYDKYDTNICQSFIAKIKDNLTLNKVILSNDQPAEIIFFNKNNYETPIVKTADNQIIDLAKRTDLKIAHIFAE